MEKELRKMLENVDMSYSDFVEDIISCVRGKEDDQRQIIEYIKANPNAGTDDILVYQEKLEGTRPWEDGDVRP